MSEPCKSSLRTDGELMLASANVVEETMASANACDVWASALAPNSFTQVWIIAVGCTISESRYPVAKA